jgi:hypothetical protein
MDFRRSAGQRAGIHSSDETLQPVGLQVVHAFDYRMERCRIIRFSMIFRDGTL